VRYGINRTKYDNTEPTHDLTVIRTLKYCEICRNEFQYDISWHSGWKTPLTVVWKVSVWLSTQTHKRNCVRRDM